MYLSMIWATHISVLFQYTENNRSFVVVSRNVSYITGALVSGDDDAISISSLNWEEFHVENWTFQYNKNCKRLSNRAPSR